MRQMFWFKHGTRTGESVDGAAMPKLRTQFVSIQLLSEEKPMTEVSLSQCYNNPRK